MSIPSHLDAGDRRADAYLALVHLAVQFGEAFGRAGRRARMVDQPTFGRFDGLRGLWNVAGDLMRNARDAMFVAVQEIAGPNGQPADNNRAAVLDDVNEGVGYENARGEELEADRPDFRQVADAAIGNGPYGTQCSVYAGIDLAPKEPTGRG